MTPSDTPPDRRPPRPEPWDEDDRKIAERPAEGEWLGPAYYRLVGRRRPLGKPVREAFPELEDGGSTWGILMVARLDHLRKLGCDVGQGFLFARPMSPDAFVDLLWG